MVPGMKRFAAPLALWLGLAAIASSSIQVTHWPTVITSVKDVQLDPEARGVELWELEHVLPATEPFLEGGLALVVIALALGAVLALAFSLFKENRGAEWFAAVCLALGTLLARTMASPAAMLRHQGAFTVASWFSVALICIVVVWAAWSMPGSIPARIAPTLVALAMATFCASRFLPPPGPSWTAVEFDAWSDAHASAPWPQLGGLALAGFALSLALRGEVNLRAAGLVLALGLVVLPRAVAIRRDELAYRPSVHSGLSVFEVPLTRKFAAAPRCREQILGVGPLVIIRDHEVLVSGTLIARTSDPPEFRAELAAKLKEVENTYRGFLLELGEQELRAIILADADTPHAVMTEVLAGALQADFARVDLANVQYQPAAWRAVRAIHRHTCVATVELADDGTPSSSFPDWAAFVQAADGADQPLRIAPR